ncbi:MAG TPA: FAD-linked oxidase C-terminal domain-containing protein [Planctomycetia bacterium]|nr:FAD-linked oxidase C-terminal domain-containing protein [Planctomycetia bacterium]
MSPAEAAAFRARLREIVGPEGVLEAEADRLVYECDGYTIEKSVPDVVVLPRTGEETAAVVKACSVAGVPFTPRGAGSSLAGGAIPLGGGAMIAMTRMNRILEIDVANRYAVVEPGVVNLWLSNKLKGTGLHYAPDPSSQGACTLGGNIATNSGGPHTLKYGVTCNHVLGAEFVLPSGEIATFGGPTEDAPGYDLCGVAIGSEGTFGICTRAWLRLTPDPAAHRTMLAIFDSAEDCSESVSRIIAAGIVPAALEMMDEPMVQAVEQAFHFGFPARLGALLIVEVDGFAAGLDRTAARCEEICRAGGATEIRRAQDEAERLAIWKCRKKAFGAIGRLANAYCCQDGVVPRSRIPAMLRFVGEVGRRHELRIVNVFHAGDGNVHPILLFDQSDAAQIERVLAASHEILDKCIELGGTVTGEHGIGVEKIGFMAKLFAPADLDSMRRVRRLFDPEGRANPRKAIPEAPPAGGAEAPEGGGFGLRAVRKAT